MASKFGKSPGVGRTSAKTTVPFLSITKDARFATPLNPTLKLSITTSYALIASLLNNAGQRSAPKVKVFLPGKNLGS